MLIMTIPLLFFILLNFNGFAFMGNSGSFIISFLIGYILLKNYNSYIDPRFSADQILLLLLYPVLDMLRLFFYRISKGKNPFLADRRHIHHVFLKKFTEKKTVFLIFLSYSIPNLLYFVLNFPLVYCLVLIAFFYSLIFIYLFLKNNKIINI
jgi:UDP-GlcNAc:undecaprenyl-phosphate GlcNAc-1-phosphate transferase